MRNNWTHSPATSHSNILVVQSHFCALNEAQTSCRCGYLILTSGLTQTCPKDLNFSSKNMKRLANKLNMIFTDQECVVKSYNPCELCSQELKFISGCRMNTSRNIVFQGKTRPMFLWPLCRHLNSICLRLWSMNKLTPSSLNTLRDELLGATYHKKILPALVSYRHLKNAR